MLWIMKNVDDAICVLAHDEMHDGRRLVFVIPSCGCGAADITPSSAFYATVHLLQSSSNAFMRHICDISIYALEIRTKIKLDRFY